MLNREKIQFNYQPARWPHFALLGMALLPLLAILLAPLALSYRLLMASLLLTFLLWQWHRLQSSAVQEILCIEQRWYVKLAGHEQRMPVVIEDYSRPFVNGLAIVLNVRPHYQPLLRVYLGHDNIEPAIFSAVCRQLLCYSEIRRT